jgi:hypothetical protein
LDFSAVKQMTITTVSIDKNLDVYCTKIMFAWVMDRSAKIKFIIKGKGPSVLLTHNAIGQNESALILKSNNFPQKYNKNENTIS